MRMMNAIKFASEKHKKQKRKTKGTPYFEHPVIVSYLISKYKGDSKHLEDLQIAALLHDTLEDTECTYSEIEYKFGPLVASLVMELTSDKKRIKEVGKNLYMMQKMRKMSKYAFILKLVDRLSNILDTPTLKYVEDTEELMMSLKRDREDLTPRQETIMEDIYEACMIFRETPEETE